MGRFVVYLTMLFSLLSVAVSKNFCIDFLRSDFTFLQTNATGIELGCESMFKKCADGGGSGDGGGGNEGDEGGDVDCPIGDPGTPCGS